MQNELQLNKPWMVAVWPGMGQVAISAGYYLMAKLEMHLFAEFSARELFEVEYVEVKGGLAYTGRLPRSRLFLWRDPEKRRDIIVFLGEAQPPAGKYAFCRRLIEYARELGVERVFTFAAMATEMRPGQHSRVFGAAADEASLVELKQLEVEILQDGHIGGLNGVLLGAAADTGMRGACLLGELPHLFAQLPFPKASLAVLEAFMLMTGIELDTSELAEQAEAMEQKLGDLLSKLERAVHEDLPEEGRAGDESEYGSESEEEEGSVSPAEEERLERLFEQAKQDRSTAYELKRELDRLGVFSDYQDRFLDLFKKPD